MASLAVKAAARQATGKGPARRARVAGKTPAVMYGGQNSSCSAGAGCT